MPLLYIILDYNGFFWEVIHLYFNFFQSYLISCLVQLLRITFYEMLHFTPKFLFLSLIFQFNAVLHFISLFFNQNRRSQRSG